jgi:hypothetical protein
MRVLPSSATLCCEPATCRGLKVTQRDLSSLDCFVLGLIVARA